MFRTAEQLDLNAMLDLKHAAVEIGLSESGLRKLVARTKARRLSGKADLDGIQFFQAGRGRILFRRSWLFEYIEAHHFEPLKQNLEALAKKPQKTKISCTGNRHGIQY